MTRNWERGQNGELLEKIEGLDANQGDWPQNRAAIWHGGSLQRRDRCVHDCASLIDRGGAAALPLRDPTYFGRAFLEFRAPTWPNSFDMDAEWLRREMIAAGELRQSVAAE